ncbi:hypothetical protein HF519_18405 [Pseudonocardia bannensis]|uniref:Uncharacterized protein n=1 Tax=Pseudonocardia bannensis TaxID=630973 RepID=A0A848DLC7_9PSEU|nr:hypothetical protein [Pseudonocardia bannensis]
MSRFAVIRDEQGSDMALRMVPPRSGTPILLAEIIDIHTGETVFAQLIPDLARAWDARLGPWTQWAASPAVQATHQPAPITPERKHAAHQPVHAPSPPPIGALVDARGTRLVAITPDPRIPRLAIAIAMTKPSRNTFVVLDLLSVHNLRSGLHSWLQWIDALAAAGLQS